MAGGGGSEFLVDAAVYLGATAVAVPLFKKLKLGTILGFLAAGVLLGPSALGLLRAEEGVFQIAELGVVLFLFVIGLELSPGRLWSTSKKSIRRSPSSPKIPFAVPGFVPFPCKL